MSFLFPLLAAGFLFVIVPPLVHLINMLRHRRQAWGAMEFLLASYRKQKKWIILRQLLLLLSRMAIAAALIAMLAGWTGGERWLDAIGGQTTHHVVILDDSYSMGDRSGSATAYSRALAALDGLARRLSTAEGRHLLTVLRSSRSGLLLRGGSDAGDAAADISAADLRSGLRSVEQLMATSPTSLADDPTAALELAADLTSASQGQRHVLYLMSDFRQRNWESPEKMKASLEAFSRLGGEIRFIDCAVAPAPNYGVTILRPMPDVWVAGVPVVIEVGVKNYASSPVRNLNLSARIVRYGSAVVRPDPTLRFSGSVESLPAIVFEQIPPGAEVKKQFQVYIAESGTHALEVQLPEDALEIDNRRTTSLPLNDPSKVLLVDGDVEGRGAYYLSTVLDPGGQVRTGAIPEIRSPAFLRSARLEELSSYRAIYLIDLPEIDAQTAAHLRSYVAGGGGLMWMVGSEALATRYNEVLYGAGSEPLLPGRLAEVVPLSQSGATSAPDMVLGEKHPLTAPLAAIGDAVFSLVQMKQSHTLELEPEKTGPIQKLVMRRDGEPLILQHALGSGQIVTVLFGLDSAWTNWNTDPTFVVFMLRANAFLWSSNERITSQDVDQAVTIPLPNDQYAQGVTYLSAVDNPPRIPVEQFAATPADATPVFQLSPILSTLDGRSDVPALLHPGISEYWLTRLDGRAEVRPIATTIVPSEGELMRAPQGDIRRILQPTAIAFYSTDEVIANDQVSGGGLMGLFLLALLALLLGFEQILAYLTSYHPPLTEVRA